MSSTIFLMAWNKRTDRRGRKNTQAGRELHADNETVNTIEEKGLLTLAGKEKSTNSTFVIAYLLSCDAWMAFGIPEDKRDQLALNLGLTSRKSINFVPTGSSTNLHGEMAIIKWLIDNEHVANASSLGGDLTMVCVGKPICADCCGYMTKLGIVHGKVCGPGSSQGWAHPTTGAIFRGETLQDFTYQKSSKYLSSATYLNQNPRLKDS